MNGPYDWLVHDHSEYETRLFACQEAVEQEDWDTANEVFRDLVTHLKRHMALEEEVLYPAYEQLDQFPQGPTKALRSEHDRIVVLIRDLKAVLKTRDAEHVIESLLPLEEVMIKHHEKEEDIFLPLAGYFLMEQKDELTKKLENFDITTAERDWGL